ncbi:putative integral membrane protein PTH11 [Daldinia grandis]|nr:putative integral membrane protein PTH11 [Daldinia grandis]
MASSLSTEDAPALQPPPGIQSNFVDPPSFNTATLIVGIISMVTMALAVGIRTYTKVVIIKEMKHEDYVALMALAGFLVWCVIYIYLSASLGFTRDMWNIRAIDMSYPLYMTNIFELIYSVSMMCAKYFILIQLKRIFCPRGNKNAVWWAIYILTTATVLYYIACFFTFLFQCTPREKIWNPAVKGTCISGNGGILSVGIINLILDLGILTVPLWAIWHLQMNPKRKLRVVAIFSVGICTCAIAAFGVAYRIPLISDPNQTRAVAKVGLWTFAEITGTIVVGCMPIFPRFYEHFWSSGNYFSAISIKNIISTKGVRTTQETHDSEITIPPQSTDGIALSIYPFRHDALRNNNYIELQDGACDNPRWTPP